MINKKFIIKSIAAGKNNVIIVSNGVSISYNEFIQRVINASRKLLQIGIKENNHVAIVDHNSVDYIITYFSLLLIKAVPCLLSVRNPIPVLNKQLKDLSCGFIISSNNELLNSIRINSEKIIFSQFIGHNIDMLGKTISQDLEYDFKLSASILYTSGTSSAPKAAAHNIGNYYYSAKGANQNIPLQNQDRWLLSLPLYHVGGLGVLYRCILNQATIVLADNNKSLSENIESNKCTHLSYVPTQLQRLVKEIKGDNQIKRLTTLKAVLVGGMKTSEKLIHRALDNELPLYLTYGLTEMTSQVVTSRVKKINGNVTQTTNLLPYRNIRITPESEILVKGETLFQGYYSAGNYELPIDGNGWYSTGDLGVINKDGHLQVTGRKDRMFVSGGENINPQEIESVMQEMPQIKNVMVISKNDREFGCRPVAFISFEDKANISKSHLIRYLKNYLPGFKIPVEFYLLPECLDDTTFKINLERLKYEMVEDKQKFVEIK